MQVYHDEKVRSVGQRPARRSCRPNSTMTCMMKCEMLLFCVAAAKNAGKEWNGSIHCIFSLVALSHPIYESHNYLAGSTPSYSFLQKERQSVLLENTSDERFFLIPFSSRLNEVKHQFGEWHRHFLQRVVLVAISSRRGLNPLFSSALGLFDNLPCINREHWFNQKNKNLRLISLSPESLQQKLFDPCTFALHKRFACMFQLCSCLSLALFSYATEEQGVYIIIN